MESTNSTARGLALPLAEPTYEVGTRKLLITLTVITCAIMELIDTSIVNVATRQRHCPGIGHYQYVPTHGGAIGIAVVNTFVTRRISVHRMDLLPNISLSNPAAVDRFQGMVMQFRAGGTH